MATKNWAIDGYLYSTLEMINYACVQGYQGCDYNAARCATYLRSRGFKVRKVS